MKGIVSTILLGPIRNPVAYTLGHRFVNDEAEMDWKVSNFQVISMVAGYLEFRCEGQDSRGLNWELTIHHSGDYQVMSTFEYES